MEQILANDQESITTAAAAKNEMGANLNQVQRAPTVVAEYLKQSRQQSDTENGGKLPPVR
jgi:hypothetical protein